LPHKVYTRVSTSILAQNAQIIFRRGVAHRCLCMIAHYKNIIRV
jgi:hypothetical protein